MRISHMDSGNIPLEQGGDENVDDFILLMSVVILALYLDSRY